MIIWTFTGKLERDASRVRNKSLNHRFKSDIVEMRFSTII